MPTFEGRFALANTTVVIVRSPEEIVIAADSKRSDPADPTRHREECKIIRLQSFVYVTTGLVEEENTGLNVPLLAIEVSKTNQKLSRKVEELEQRVSDDLLKTHGEIRLNNPRLYERVSESISGTNIIIAGLESGVPRLFERMFNIVWTRNTDVEVRIWKRDCPNGINCDREEGFSAYGQTDAIRLFLANKATFWEAGFVEGARKLVELEIADKPEQVGPPIDIVRIDKRGSHWIQRKAQCPEFL